MYFNDVHILYYVAVAISEGELARRTGLSKMTISRYLNKKRMPTLKALVNLSYVLCVPITDLIPTYAMID